MKRPPKSQVYRRSPSQARSQQTVACVLDGAARVFRREGFAATTNRIAAEAGVSIGSLYEYFPNKQALLVALAERHVSEAERAVAAALSGAASTRDLLRALQAAILASQRYPSQALEHIARADSASALRERVGSLRQRVLSALRDRARSQPDAELRARTAFGLIAELTSLSAHECQPAQHAALADHLLQLAHAQLDL